MRQFAKKQILFVHPRKASFIELDRELLAERWEIVDLYQPGRWSNPVKVAAAVRGCDGVVGWWASWHTFWPFIFAPLLKKPSLLIVGGFDIANERDIGYGYQQGGARKYLSRLIIKRATRLMTNSEYSRSEFLANIGTPRQPLDVVYHGVPDRLGRLRQGPRDRLAITVGNVDSANLERKGLRAFVEAAALLPDVEFVVVGRLLDDGAERLRELAGPNVKLVGFVSDEELFNLYERAAVYVQASQHEGFGVSVAEAMLGGCVPVVTRRGALPEVVGDVGIMLDSREATAIAEGIRTALALDSQAPTRARERILVEFPVQKRRSGLQDLVGRLLGV